ncbi:glucose 1-dehydrogenase [uncultured Paludibaculum sp.]|uniref:SDR family NAD(P)-dependent oxidoreductase n=1 Tax=uncultured Paludibaculum sp. TaxID=1765020 RepID=UPI002AAAE6A1|nr:glucose 1-dehydrogenase [uncultured Paludibaculum sp.]
MPTLTGKTAIVTGASLGIGAAIARKLAAEGASVAVNYARSKAQAETVVDEIRKAGGKAIAVQADLRDAAQITKLFDETVKAFGKVDVLVNNAGQYEFQPLAEVTEEHIDKHFDLNVKSLILATKEAVKVFGDNGGNIINISSIVAQGAVPNGSVYSATKAAVDSLTRSWAAELGPKKIIVNAVSPGATVTEGVQTMDPQGAMFNQFIAKTPFGRLGQPDDIANVVAFLAGSQAAWITGEALSVSGGLRA